MPIMARGRKKKDKLLILDDINKTEDLSLDEKTNKGFEHCKTYMTKTDSSDINIIRTESHYRDHSFENLSPPSRIDGELYFELTPTSREDFEKEFPSHDIEAPI